MQRGVRTELTDEEGASMVEYAFLIAGIAVIVAIAAVTFGPAISELFGRPLPWL